jgi:predicted secreted protein
MAASTGINTGTMLGLYIGGTLVAHGMSSDLSVDVATRDVTTKDSGGWASFKAGLRSWNASGSFLFAEDASVGFSDIFASIGARTVVVLKIWTGVTGDNWYTGDAIITSASMTGGVEDNQTFDVSFQGTGELEEAAV